MKWRLLTILLASFKKLWAIHFFKGKSKVSFNLFTVPKVSKKTKLLRGLFKGPPQEHLWDMKKKIMKNLQGHERMLCIKSYQRRGMEVKLSSPLIVMWLQEDGGISGSNVSSKTSKVRGNQRRHVSWKRSYKLKTFKEEGKNITFPSYDGTFGATDKVLAFIQQFDASFRDNNFFESSKLGHVSMHFQKNHPVNGGQVFVPQDKLQRLGRFWGLLSWSDSS